MADKLTKEDYKNIAKGVGKGLIPKLKEADYPLE